MSLQSRTTLSGYIGLSPSRFSYCVMNIKSHLAQADDTTLLQQIRQTTTRLYFCDEVTMDWENHKK